MSETSKTTDGTQDTQAPGKVASREPESPLDSMTIAIFDVDTRIFRTMLDSFIKAPAVATAAIQRDYALYLSPIRVFIALFSFQFVVAALFGTPVSTTIDSLVVGLPDADIDVWLTTARHSFETPLTQAQVDDALKAAQSLMLWPLTVISSLPYLVALKLYRPSTPLWGHVQIYLVATNASFILMISLIPLHLLGISGMMTGMLVAAVAYFTVMGIFLAHFYGQTVLGLILRLAGLIALLPITFLITMVGTILTVDWVLEHEFGLDILTPWRRKSSQTDHHKSRKTGAG